MIDSRLKQTLLKDVKGLIVLSASPDRRSEALSTSEELFDLPGGFGISTPPSPLRIPENIQEQSEEENANDESPHLLNGPNSEKENVLVPHKNIRAGKPASNPSTRSDHLVKDDRKQVENIQAAQSQRKSTYIRRLLGLDVTPITVPKQESSNLSRLSLPNARSNERSPVRIDPPRLSPSRGRGPGGFHSAPAASRLLQPTTASMAKARNAISPSGKNIKSKRAAKYSPCVSPSEVPLSPTAATLLEATRILSLVAATQPSGDNFGDGHGWRSPEWSKSRRRNVFMTPSKSRPEVNFDKFNPISNVEKKIKERIAGSNSFADVDDSAVETENTQQNDLGDTEKSSNPSQVKTQIPSLGSRSRISKAWVGSGMKQGEIRSASPRGSGSYTSPSKPRGLSPLRVQSGVSQPPTLAIKPKGKPAEAPSTSSVDKTIHKQADAGKTKKKVFLNSHVSDSTAIAETESLKSSNSNKKEDVKVSSNPIRVIKRSESPMDRKSSVEKGNKVPLKDVEKQAKKIDEKSLPHNHSFDPLPSQDAHIVNMIIPSDFSNVSNETVRIPASGSQEDGKKTGGEDDVSVDKEKEKSLEEIKEREEKEDQAEGGKNKQSVADGKVGKVIENPNSEKKDNPTPEKKFESDHDRPKSTSQNNLPRVALLSNPNQQFRNSDPGLGANAKKRFLGKLSNDKTSTNKSKLKEDENSEKSSTSKPKSKTPGRHSWPFNKWWK